MKKNGFTLVELMVVVMVVGILASIATPQFTNAMARARAAEVPLNLNKIKSGQEAYRAETKRYADQAYWGYSTKPQNTTLGLKIDASKFFKYNTMETNTGYNANAVLIKNIGGAKAENDLTVTLNETDSSYVHGGKPESRTSITLYLKTFITPKN